MTNTYIYLEGFASFVLIWVFLSLSVMTAIVILRGIDRLAGVIYNRLTRPSKTELAIEQANARIAVIERKMQSHG